MKKKKAEIGEKGEENIYTHIDGIPAAAAATATDSSGTAEQQQQRQRRRRTRGPAAAAGATETAADRIPANEKKGKEIIPVSGNENGNGERGLAGTAIGGNSTLNPGTRLFENPRKFI